MYVVVTNLDGNFFFFPEYPFSCQPVLYYDFDKICAGEIFDESGLGNNGMSRGRVVIEPGYNEDNGVELSDGYIQLDGMNFKVGDDFIACCCYNVVSCTADIWFVTKRFFYF